MLCNLGKSGPRPHIYNPKPELIIKSFQPKVMTTASFLYSLIAMHLAVLDSKDTSENQAHKQTQNLCSHDGSIQSLL